MTSHQFTSYRDVAEKLAYSSYTLHGTRSGTGTRTRMDTIENNGSLFLSLYNVYSTWHNIKTHRCPVPVPVPVSCSVNEPLQFGACRRVIIVPIFNAYFPLHQIISASTVIDVNLVSGKINEKIILGSYCVQYWPNRLGRPVK